MIIWSTWKERNRRIFRNQSWPEGKIKEILTSMIRETVMSSNSQEGSAQPIDQDSRVLEVFQLTGGRNPNLNRQQSQLQVGEHNWKPPPPGSLKLNFDGAEKGNPRRIGLGGLMNVKGTSYDYTQGACENQPITPQNSGPWRQVWRFSAGRG
jgi:hypothetical protein